MPAHPDATTRRVAPALLTALALAVPATATATTAHATEGVPGTSTHVAGDPGHGKALNVGFGSSTLSLTALPDGTTFVGDDVIHQVAPDGHTTTVVGAGNRFLPAGNEKTSARPASQIGRMDRTILAGTTPQADLVFTDHTKNGVYLLSRSAGTKFGRTMRSGMVYRVLGGGGSVTEGDLGYKMNDNPDGEYSTAVDREGTVLAWALQKNSTCRLLAVPATTGTHYGRQMTAGAAYVLRDLPNSTYSCRWNRVWASRTGLMMENYLGYGTTTVTITPDHDGTWFGQAMTANQPTTVALPTMEGPQLTATGDIQGTVNGVTKLLAATDGTRYGITMTAGRLYDIPARFTDHPSGAMLLNTPAGSCPGGTVCAYSPTATALFGTTVPASTPTAVAGTGSELGRTQGVDPRQYQLGEIRRFDGTPDGSYALTSGSAIHFVPATSGTYFGRAMQAGKAYRAVGSLKQTSVGGKDGQPTTDPGYVEEDYMALTRDAVVASPTIFPDYLLAAPKQSGTLFGRAMEGGRLYHVPIASPLGDASDPTQSGADIAYVDRGNYSSTIRLLAARDTTVGGISVPAGQTAVIGGGGSGLNFGAPATQSGLHVQGLFQAPDGTIMLTTGATFDQVTLAFIPRTDGVKFGQQVRAGYLYRVAGGSGSVGSPVRSAYVGSEIAVDSVGNILTRYSNTWHILPFTTGTYYGVPVTAGVVAALPATPHTSFEMLAPAGDSLIGTRSGYQFPEQERLFRLER